MSVLRRKRARRNDGSVANRNDIGNNRGLNGIRPAESTILLEVGGASQNINQDERDVGNAKTITISASFGETEAAIYDNFFWSNNFSSYTQGNCAIGLVVYGYNSTTRRAKQCIIPLVIPPLTKLSWGAYLDRPDFVESNYHALLEQVAYCLNLQFCATTQGLEDYRGFSCNPVNWFRIPQYDIYIPVSTSPTNIGNLPPMRWIVTQDNRLALVFDRNTNEGLFPYAANNLAFNLITLQSSFFTEAAYFKTNNLTTHDFYCTSHLASPAPNSDSMLNNANGWIGKGFHQFGFGNQIATSSGVAYLDDYEPGLTSSLKIGQTYTRDQMFAVTQDPHRNPTDLFATIDDWYDECTRRGLWVNKSGGIGIMVAPRPIVSLAASRYYTIQSDALTRNQRRSVSSNSPLALASSPLCGVFFPPFDGVPCGNFYYDTSNLAANADDSANGGAYSLLAPRAVFQPVIHTRSNESRDVIDLIMSDEYGTTIQNPVLTATQPFSNQAVQIIPPLNQEYTLVTYKTPDDGYWNVNLNQFSPAWKNDFTGPVWPINAVPNYMHIVWNPDTVRNPNGACLLGGSLNSISMVYIWGPPRWASSSARNYRFPCNRDLATPPGCTLTHFVRLIGNS